jgi:hypothetical protein
MPIPFLKHAAAACCLGLLATAPAQATEILNFTYNGSPFIITGSMAGALALDGNTFVPTTWLSIKVNGTPVGTGIPGAAVFGAGGPFNQAQVAAVVKLDGSSENFASFPVYQDTNLIFQTPDVNSYPTPIQVNGFGGDAWELSQWNASIDAPEPASLALFGVGAAVLGMVRRRRA